MSSTEPQTRPRLLIVDDEENVVQILQDLFAERPYEVESVNTGEDALDRIRVGGFDLILTDINLPGADGMEVLAAAKASDPDVAVVVITGYASTHTAIKALRQGAHDYVTKPFDLWDVDKIVARGLENRRLVIENRRLLLDLKTANQELRHHEEILTEEVNRATHQIRTLYEISKDVNASLDVSRTLEYVVAQAAKLTGARSGLLFRTRENTGSLVAEVGCGPAAELTGTAQVHAGKGITGRVAQSLAPVRAEAAECNETYLTELGAETVLSVPLVHQGKLLGVLNAIDKEDGAFTGQDQELLDSFASSAAVALANAELFEHIKVLDQLKSDFVAVVSHEVRTPLTSIQGTLELVMDKKYFQLEPKMHELLEICDTNVERLRVLIGDILDFSKIERDKLPLEFAELDTPRLAADVVATMESIAARKELTLALVCNDSLPEMVGDRVRLGQVFTNLIDNAMKFSEPGSEVRVTVQPTVDGGVEVRVIDSGPGIGAKDLGKLFQKFQQVDSALTRKQGGLGLGLVISKGIVEGHGGRIWVESEVGHGSQFCFQLPAVPPRLDSLPEEEKKAA